MVGKNPFLWKAGGLGDDWSPGRREATDATAERKLQTKCYAKRRSGASQENISHGCSCQCVALFDLPSVRRAICHSDFRCLACVFPGKRKKTPQEVSRTLESGPLRGRAGERA